MSLRSEINGTLRRLLKDGAVLIGESIRDPFGGAAKVTRGLTKGFDSQIIDMPICEQAQVGYAIGVAMTGKVVVLEIMFANFMSLVVSQLVDVGLVMQEYHNIPFKLIIRTMSNDNKMYGPNHSGEMYWLLGGLMCPVYHALPGEVDDLYTEVLNNGKNISIIIEEKTQYNE